MTSPQAAIDSGARTRHLQRALVLSALSIAISGLVGLVAVGVGLATDRLSLLGFGFDAAVDAAASVVLFWRFRIEATNPTRAERAERVAEIVVGCVLLTLAAFLGLSAIQALATGSRPDATAVGLGISAGSVLVLPMLAIGKRRTAAALGSRALRADGVLTGIAAMLALISLAGFVLTETLGVASADAVGGLIVTAVLVREGIAPFRTAGLEELDLE